MKLKALLAILLVAVVASCSSDEAGTDMSTFHSDSNYFPLNIENSWTYNNERKIEGETAVQSNGTMTVADALEENGTTFYDLNVDKPEEAGLTTGIFSSGKLTKRNGDLIFSGNYKIEFPGYGSVELPITAVVVFSSTEDAGTELTNFSNSVKQNINVQGELVPVSINYTISTTNEGFLPTFDTGGETFEDVLQANLLVTASVTTLFGQLPVEVVLMAEQDVLRISNYYANEVGLIYSNATIDYEFKEIPSLPTIPNVHIESSQEIDVYTVAID